MPSKGEVWLPEPGRIRRVRDGLLLSSGGLAVRTPWLPHEQRPRPEMIAASRKVLGHEMQPYRLSVSNDGYPDYMDRKFMPPGEVEGAGQTWEVDHTVYGGFWRDRPRKIPRPRSGTDWRIQDRADEVRDAIGAGMDGFANDILTAESTNTNWVNGTMELLTAIEKPEFGGTFLYVPEIDGTASIGTSISGTIRSLGTILGRPSVYKRGGFPVVLSFAPESVSGGTSDQDWWTQVYNGVKSQYGFDFRGWGSYNGSWKPLATAFDPLPFWIGHGRWAGNRDAVNAVNLTSTDFGAATAQYTRDTFTKKLWFGPVAAQDSRPDQGRAWESDCTEALRGNFMQARVGAWDAVHLITTNDFRETGLMPSEGSGYAWYDLIAFLTEWYKFGVAPTIVRDAVYLTHRTQRTDLPTATFTSKAQTKFLAMDGSTAARNNVEGLCFPTAPATLELNICGSVTHTDITQAMLDTAQGGPVSIKKVLPAGVSGAVSARMIRSGNTVPGTPVTSIRRVEAVPLVQNWWYYCTSSLRQAA